MTQKKSLLFDQEFLSRNGNGICAYMMSVDVVSEAGDVPKFHVECAISSRHNVLLMDFPASAEDIDKSIEKADKLMRAFARLKESLENAKTAHDVAYRSNKLPDKG